MRMIAALRKHVRPPFARYFSLLAILKIALVFGRGMGDNSFRFGLARGWGKTDYPRGRAASNRSRRRVWDSVRVEPRKLYS